MSMTIDHGVDVAKHLAKQATELREAVERSADTLREAAEIAADLHRQCKEFPRSDFVTPYALGEAGDLAEHVAQTLRGELYDDAVRRSRLRGACRAPDAWS
jgi:hypothetical protein